MFKLVLVILLAIVLGGCSSPSSEPPSVTAQIIQVDIISELEWLRPAMAECAQQLSGFGLQVVSGTPDNLDTRDSDILLRWTNQSIDEGFAFVLGEDTLTVVVNPANSIESLGSGTIRDMYSGQITDWAAAGSNLDTVIQLWVMPADDGSMMTFQSSLLEGGLVSQAALIAPNPASIRSAVADSTGAIGFVPARWLDETVKTIEITDFSPNAWTFPILAITSSEPAGLARDWLLCVQDHINN